MSDPSFRFGSPGSRILIDPDPRFAHTKFRILFPEGRICGFKRDILVLIRLSDVKPDSSHLFTRNGLETFLC